MQRIQPKHRSSDGVLRSGIQTADRKSRVYCTQHKNGRFYVSDAPGISSEI
jgi:hypothetical protein